jgi:hypothetical protein
LTSDDMLIGYELVERREEITYLESQKTDALGVTRRNANAEEVINRLRAEKQVDAIMIVDLSPIIYKGLDILLKWTMDSETLPAAVSKNKRTRVAKWIQLQNTAARDDDEAHPEGPKSWKLSCSELRVRSSHSKLLRSGKRSRKGVKDAFAMIVAASPTTKQTLLARLSEVRVNTELNLCTVVVSCSC